MKETITFDFAKFGSRERHMAKELLERWEEQGLPEDFDDENIRIMMNIISGNVFLTNEDFQVAMLNDSKLESFYSCPQCGYEGFKEELFDDGEECCQEYIRSFL